jgi:hypothetical protein
MPLMIVETIVLFNRCVPMHCPYCSAKLAITSGGELRCPSTGALLSVSVRTQFEELALNCASGKPPRFDIGQWFCPCCGKKTRSGVCGDCGVVVTVGLARELLELNPHVRG